MKKPRKPLISTGFRVHPCLQNINRDNLYLSNGLICLLNFFEAHKRPPTRATFGYGQENGYLSNMQPGRQTVNIAPYSFIAPLSRLDRKIGLPACFVPHSVSESDHAGYRRSNNEKIKEEMT